MEQLKSTCCISKQTACKTTPSALYSELSSSTRRRPVHRGLGGGNSNTWKRKAINSMEEGITSAAPCFAEAVLMETGALAEPGVLGLPPSLCIWPAGKSDPVRRIASASGSGVRRLRTPDTALCSTCRTLRRGAARPVRGHSCVQRS